jgi:acetylornithine/succinyldiaminopimelate/putrescine aminotransferase
MVALGKGLPGGEFPASRLLFRPHLDVLPQFAALVTNGQEELASLAYLVTMTWCAANGQAIAEYGALLEREVRELAASFPQRLAGVDGHGHLLGLRFRDVECGKAFAEHLNRAGYDLSVQTYKAACPPVALCKLPVTADEALIGAFVAACRDGLTAPQAARRR